MINIKETQKWYAEKRSIDVSEFDDYDSYLCKVANSYINSIDNESKIWRFFKAIIKYVLFIPLAILYFLLLVGINPLQYLFTGKSFIAQKYHKYISIWLHK